MDKKKGQTKMKTLTYIIVVVLSIQFGCKDDPVGNGKTQNRNPVISSVVLFPDVVAPSDSLIVICNATDADGDTLVYDWYSLSGPRVRINGARPGAFVLYNTPENWRIFYAPDSQYVAAPQDTFGLECAVRDLRGGTDVSGILRFIVTRAF